MKRRLLLALTGLVFGLAAPAVLAKFDELNHNLEAAYDRNAAAAVAALFTEDAVLVAADGVFSGRQQIE
jgi:hypothetical protein